MKKLLLALGLAVMLGPGIALADENAAPPTAAQMAQFRQLHDRMRQLHEQARSQILASISASHKTQLANIIGQLAISSNPNPDAAARQINALLSPSEAQSVVRIHNAVRSQMRSIMETAHAQMHPQGTPPEREMKPGAEMTRPVDAGHILLMLGGMHEGMHHGM